MKHSLNYNGWAIFCFVRIKSNLEQNWIFSLNCIFLFQLLFRGMFGGDCSETCHRLPVGADHVCELCIRSNSTALEEYFEDVSDWESMHSGWVCTGTGGLQHMQATGCCCAAISKPLVVARGRNRAISELLFGVMERLRSDAEGGSCILPEFDGAVQAEQTVPFQIAPVLTTICKYAAPEVVAFLKGITPGVEMEPERLVLLMDNLNPGVDITLPDCLDTEGCLTVLPHATCLLEEGTEAEAPDGEENPLGDSV